MGVDEDGSHGMDGRVGEWIRCEMRMVVAMRLVTLFAESPNEGIQAVVDLREIELRDQRRQRDRIG